MKHDRTFRYFIYHFTHAVEWIAGILVALLALTATQTASDYNWKVVQDLILWSQNHKLFIFLLASLAVVAKFVREQIGPPWAWRAIKDLLDTWHSKTFANIPNAAADEHRITIFKRVPRWRTIRRWLELPLRTNDPKSWKYKKWPVGWFKPVARSQHVSQRNVTWFPCFDAARLGEGFVGIVWRKNGTVRIPSPPDTLPDLNPHPPTVVSDADYRRYAGATRVTERWLQAREGKNHARSMCGTKIERNGKEWGVLVIDSRSTTLTVLDDNVEFAAAALGKFIERA